jgi:hypothetical protein
MFFRSFVAASVDGSISPTGGGATITAGQGLTGGGTGDVTLNVGAGNGLAVNANDVSVDIFSQSLVQPAVDDEVMICDHSDNNAIRKASVRDLTGLAAAIPGGSDTQVQYNSGGVFAGTSGLTTDSSGNLTAASYTVTGGTKISRATVDFIRFDGTTGNAPHIVSDGAGGYSLYGPLPGGWANNANLQFLSATTGNRMLWNFDTNNTISMDNSSGTGTGVRFNGQMSLGRCLTTGITASTTQTQGNGALTKDYNDVTTVANANDTVTLPAAYASRFCIVTNNGANILQVFPASGDNLGAGVDAATTIAPGAQYSWFAIDGTTWRQMDGVWKQTVKSGITASTTQTQGQQALTKDVNEVSTVANANDVVTMPTAPSYSRTVTIINNGANTLQIFPASGDNLGAGVNISVTLAAGSNVKYTNYDSTNWKNV